MPNFKKAEDEMIDTPQIDYKLFSDKLIDGLLASMNAHGQLNIVNGTMTPESRQIFTNSLEQIFESLKKS
jgi:hypothetical protein